MKGSFVLFTGGTAWNPFVQVLSEFANDVAYIIPVSDDGGSTAEIIRVFGGPGIGDLRSRLIRLARNETAEDKAVLDLLSHRLPIDTHQAIAEWEDILHGRHKLWNGITTTYKDTILAFLSFFQNELNDRLKSMEITALNAIEEQQRFLSSDDVSFPEADSPSPDTINHQKNEPSRMNPTQPCIDISILKHAKEHILESPDSFHTTIVQDFDFRHGSVGNFLLTGCRLFFKSLDAAMFQLARLLGCPSHTIVIPATRKIVEKKRSNRSKCPVGKMSPDADVSYTKRRPECDFEDPSWGLPPLERTITVIAALLRDGTKIIGQCEISHPGSTVGENAPVERRISLSGRSPALSLISDSDNHQSPSVKNYHTLNLGLFRNLTLDSPLSSIAEHARFSNGIIRSPSGQKMSSSPGLTYLHQLHQQHYCSHASPQLNQDIPKKEGQKNYLSSSYSSSSPISIPKREPSKLPDANASPQSKSAPIQPNSFTRASSNIFFNKSKTEHPPLASPIRRIFYVNHHGHEIIPRLNPLIPTHLDTRHKTIIYAVGSLYTSLLPSLIVEGVGRRIAGQQPLQDLHVSQLDLPDSAAPFSSGSDTPSPGESNGWIDERKKLLILNGTLDRETAHYTALDFILAITDALNYSCWAETQLEKALKAKKESHVYKSNLKAALSRLSNGPPPLTRTHSEDSDMSISPDHPSWESLNDIDSPISPAVLANEVMSKMPLETMESEQGRCYIVSPYLPCRYITHIAYLEGGEVKVDQDAIQALGIECIRVTSTHVDPKVYHDDDMRYVFQQLLDNK